MIRRALGSIFLVACFASHSSAWCYKEHIQFTRIAAERLITDPTTPPAMKAWLEKCLPQRSTMAGEEDYFLHARLGLSPKGYDSGLLYWCWAPDWHALNDPKDSKVAQFGAHERLMHFIDLEYFVTGDQKREYRPDLSAKPKIDAIPDDPTDPRYVQAGYLPLRVEQAYRELVKSIREGRLQPASETDHDNAVYWAGYLAHYVADNTQPHHSTADYKSASYFKNPRKAPNVHAAMEYEMCDGEKNDYPELRGEFWPMFVKQLESFEDPIKTDAPFQATLEVSMISYDALPLIGEAAAASSAPAGKGDKTDVLDLEKFFRYPGNVDGEPMTVMQMKARQTAWAVKRIERIWKQAWLEATK